MDRVIPREGERTVDLNEVTLIGNVTQDPRQRDLPSGDVTTTFSVATNYQWRDPATKEQHRSVDCH
jgi:single-stranded DNA-binding protein